MTKYIMILAAMIIFCACDSPRPAPEQKAETAFERQLKEKAARKQAAVTLAKERLEITNEADLESFFEPNEKGAVFRDTRTGVCLIMLYDTKTKAWSPLGMIKGKSLDKDLPADTYGELITTIELKNLVNEKCSR